MTERFDQGLEVRRAVLGAEHVDRSLEQASPFMRPMQELVTEYCWGAVWTRDGLDRRTRSLVNLGMLTALGKSQELIAHRAGHEQSPQLLARVAQIGEHLPAELARAEAAAERDDHLARDPAHLARRIGHLVLVRQRGFDHGADETPVLS